MIVKCWNRLLRYGEGNLGIEFRDQEFNAKTQSRQDAKYFQVFASWRLCDLALKNTDMTKILTKLAFLSLLIPAFASISSAQKVQTMDVKVFFHNEKLNPNMDDCRKVFPTVRTIPKTAGVARAALDELFKGTTEAERAKEFWSYSPEETKDIIKGLNIKGGVAYLNFKKIVFEKLGNSTTSCGGGFYPSIEKTLTQFPTIKKVIYAVEGNTNDFYEWVQVGECPYGKKQCSAANFN